MQNTAEDISHQAQGHKANLSNPNTSDASKAHSKEVLDSLGGDKAFYSDEDQNASKNPNQVAGGLKAAINNDGIPESGKAKAQEKLDNM
ncbi:MAG: hypothetical protein L6R35_002813 [Caloplaca aegaea]|nr:MAG: hypothetical protein L6R35_002813 [Caloplaca aegaea]